MGPEDEVVIFYWEKGNIYTDECGFTIDNIYKEILPNYIYLFRLKKEDMYVRNIHGQQVALLYECEYENISDDNGNIIDRREINYNE